MLGALGIYWHQLWLLYLGYGVIGGCGLGLGYVSPVSTLIRWFPDYRGMATGMAIMGFGGGAMIGAPLKRFFIQWFYEAPEYLGSLDQLRLITEAGRRFVEIAGEQLEVVVIGANDVANMLVPGPEGDLCRWHGLSWSVANLPDIRSSIFHCYVDCCIFLSSAAGRLATRRLCCADRRI